MYSWIKIATQCPNTIRRCTLFRYYRFACQWIKGCSSSLFSLQFKWNWLSVESVRLKGLLSQLPINCKTKLLLTWCLLVHKISLNFKQFVCLVTATPFPSRQSLLPRLLWIRISEIASHLLLMVMFNPFLALRSNWL